ncbi:MAG: 2-succinyl-5-enolpyruvyl-6-hydroxy-3-cyclohexene-1-carboxylic-acid synthase [Thermodesulfobacteriota bacterium]|nr:2-succinyl-5-enolpyruvyl-6-hydroxy-3-cyclohexene-1-carboxylic-acid synthase [Thermodesulfobacteriota bacterium]
MKLPQPNLNALWASLLIEELIRNGIDYFCLAPGSRSTPLTVAVAENGKAKTSLHYDERGVAFHALGYGRATGRPAGVITTSGTAVPNLMPAVVEAAMDQIPLLVITADRPPELRDCAANQTIDQTKIFGDFVQWFVDLACPSRQIPAKVILSTIDQAVHRSIGPIAGPVHINCMFREPLDPKPANEDFRDYLAPLAKWLPKSYPYTEYERPVRMANPKALDDLSQLLDKVERGLVVIGRLSCPSEQSAASALIETLRWPVCADITSGLKSRGISSTILACHDVLIRTEAFAAIHHPEVVLQLGGRFVSKHLEAFIQQSDPDHYVLVTNHPKRQDPSHRVSLRIEGDLGQVCHYLADRLSPRPDSPWLVSWQKASARARQVFETFAQREKTLSEPQVARLISRYMASDQGLFIASSMPIRDMDLFADALGPAISVGSNRGASGIDGTIAAAAGFAAGLRKPLSLLTGDLAFLHDLNSLNFLRCADYPVMMVVINNDGGGIFSFLPIAQFDRFFEKYFVTPHGLTFEKAAQMFGIQYYHPETAPDFQSCYEEALAKGHSAIVEVTLDRKKNHALHMQLLKDMQDALRDDYKDGAKDLLTGQER